MREIKFKVWDIDNQRMFNDSFRLIKEGYVEWIQLKRDSSNNLIWLQYTGLKDKNGKEICEGDILRWKDRGSNFPNVITNIKPVVIKNLNSMSPMIFDKKCFQDAKNDWYEVIGNIYENPKLLEKQ